MNAIRQLGMMMLVMLVSAPTVAAPCLVGDVVRVVGQAVVHRAERATLSAEVGMKVCRGDRFETQEASIVELRLRDGTLLTIGKNTDFTVREFRIYKERPNEALFDLAKGAFRSVTGFITRRAHRYEVRTAVATIGVRGTDFWGGYGLTKDGLDVLMLEGKGVYVETAAGRVELDQPGLGTTVISGQAPAAAKAWPEEKVKRAVATITP